MTPEIPALDLPARLVAWRQWAGLTQAQLARAMGLARQQIFALENGEVDSPKVSSIERFCTTIGISLAQFWGLTPPLPPLPPKRDAA